MQNDKILSPTDREMLIRQLKDSLANHQPGGPEEQEDEALSEDYYLEVKDLLSRIEQKS